MKLLNVLSPTILLAVSIFLIRLPPFSTPFFITTHAISRIIVLLGLFLYLTYYPLRTRRLLSKKSPHLYFLLVWFLAVSLSVIDAHNIPAFIWKYKDVVSGILMYLLAFLVITRKNIRTFIKIIYSATIITIPFQLAVYYYPELALKLLKLVTQDSYLQFFSFQVSRNRYFGEWLDETSIAISFYFLIQHTPWGKKIVHMSIIFVLTLITILSNWRTKSVIHATTIVSSLLVYMKHAKNRYVSLLILFFIFSSFVISNRLTLQSHGENVIDRLLFGGIEEQETIESRYDMWYEARKMGDQAFPFGVGLGNYHDNLPLILQLLHLSSMIERPQSFLLIDDPHNIFFSLYAQTGIIGLASFTLLILYYLFQDTRSFFDSYLEIKIFIIMFWGVFLFSLFNPWLYFSYVGYFFFLRGGIDALRTKPTHVNGST